MILENYNGSLPSNVETDSTFKSDKSPVVLVRKFKNTLASAAEHLVITYFVSDAEDSLYEKDITGNTFTTIIAFDENLIDAASNDIPSIQQTTYGGEFVFDVDLSEINIDSPGMHSFSIRCIQNNGVGSATSYYRFFIRNQEEDAKVLDMDDVSSFVTPDVTGTELSEHFYKLVSAPRYSGSSNSGALTLFKEYDYAKYTVSVVKDGNDIDYIQIAVDGCLKYECPIEGSSYTHTDIDISSQQDAPYKLVTKVTVNGVTKPLTDYLNTASSDLPADVISTAARNKIALTMLMRAAKAFGKNRLVLPEGMDIVFDYRNRLGTSATMTYHDSVLITTSHYDAQDKDNVTFPDYFTLDLNGSTIHVLKSNYIENSYVLRFHNNIDTHVVNGFIRGSYEGFNFGSVTYESMHVAGIRRCCMFCSFEDVDISRGLGYELTLKPWHDFLQFDFSGTHAYVEQAPFFNNYGYIDYDGVVHNESETDGTGVLSMMFTGDVGNACSNDNYHSTSDYYGTRYLNYKGLQHVSDTVWVVRTDAGNTAFDSFHRGVGTDIFIHYYRNDLSFIKTVKASTFTALICPYGAAYARLSMKGIHAAGCIDSLNRQSQGAFMIERLAYSWCNSFTRVHVHDTRSCVVGMLGGQSHFEDCVLWNIADIPEYKDHHLTTMFFDYEEGSYTNHSIYMTDNESLYSNVNGFKMYGASYAEVARNHGLGSGNFAKAGVRALRYYGNNYMSLTKTLGTRYPRQYTHIEANNIDMLSGYMYEPVGSVEQSLTLRYNSVNRLGNSYTLSIRNKNNIIKQKYEEDEDNS